MKRTYKNLLFSFLTLIILLCSIACSNNKDNNLKYSEKEINEFKANFEYEGLIEEENVTITKYIGNDIEVVIPKFVTEIGDYAFYGCSSLTNIEIPNSVTTSGWYAFLECISLTNITIPNSVISIGSDAFDGCSSLQYNEYENCLYLGNKENPYLYLFVIKDKDANNVLINHKTKFIGSYAFSYCGSLISIEIPNSVTNIGVSAFSGCSNITSIEIPDSVTNI